MNNMIIDNNVDARSDEEAFDKSARELFDSIDKDGDGFIGANELMNYLTGNVIDLRVNNQNMGLNSDLELFVGSYGYFSIFKFVS